MKLDSEFLMFALVSGIQGGANYGTYLLILLVAPWWVAFLCALCVGIVLQTILQFNATFKSRLTITAGARYIAYQLAYVAVFGFLLGTVIALGVLPALGPLVVLAIVTPVNFVLTRLVIIPRGSSASARSAPRGR